MSVCSGAFILGEAGLLDGRECTTHWTHVGELAERFPEARVNGDVLYVDSDGVLTSAGTAAGIDANGLSSETLSLDVFADMLRERMAPM